MFKLQFRSRGKTESANNTNQSSAVLATSRIGREKVGSTLKSISAGIALPADYGYSERISLYRFLRENIPIINGALWVWVRLCSSPMLFQSSDNSGLKNRLDKLGAILAPNDYFKSGGLERLSDLFFSSLLIDGAFAGMIETDASGRLTAFTPCDIRNLSFEKDDEHAGWRIYHETPDGRILLDSSRFIYIPLDDDANDPRGRSILQAVGFVSRLEQKLLDDMQKSQEKAGYNRLHVLVKKPERRMGESEPTYIERANSYFEDTVTLFSGIKPADSAVTWDDIEIKSIGPASGSGNATHSWYLSHRALVEDICAGLHLDPFMLGYSYSSTQTWARFKYELVLREIISIQRLAVRFFEWLINNYQPLENSNDRVTVSFDNDRVNSILEKHRAEKEASDRVIELFKAGILSRDEARERVLKYEGGR
jgi:hypothetical protein